MTGDLPGIRSNTALKKDPKGFMVAQQPQPLGSGLRQQPRVALLCRRPYARYDSSACPIRAWSPGRCVHHPKQY